MTTGVLLAAGAGLRAGGPKALRHHLDGTPWLVGGVRTLLDGGCASAVVVLGCEADRARSLLGDLATEPRVTVQVVPDWARGMSHSLRAGLEAVERDTSGAALIHLVDLPDVTPDVVRRLLDRAPVGSEVLARAGYRGRAGHPVLVGRDHLGPLLVALAGLRGADADRGARTYLAERPVVLVECGDLAGGQDRDGPD
jgi:CTP:molybdopterin cytidylyltransferase MocA